MHATVLTLVLAALLAQDPPEKKGSPPGAKFAKGKGEPAVAAPADPAWTALEREFQAAWQAHQLVLQDLQQKGVSSEQWPPTPAGEFWDRCAAFAGRGELAAIRWCVAYSEALGLPPAERNQKRLALYRGWAKDLKEGPALKEFVRGLQAEAGPNRLGPAATGALLAEIAARVEDRTLRAEARIGHALALLAARDTARAREQIELAAKDAPESELLPRARGRLFQLDRLQIGMDCPDFTAKDPDGVEFKLSEYRGKVVVLDFWGFW